MIPCGFGTGPLQANGSWAAVPPAAQLDQVSPAFLFEPKSGDIAVVKQQIPFVAIAMLKNPTSIEIVLAHGCGQGMDRMWNQRVRLPEFPEGEMEGLLVAMQVLIIEIRILIEPKGEAQRAPATSLVEQHLTGFKLGFFGRTQPATPPDRARLGRGPGTVIGPKRGTGFQELRRFEQEAGVNHWNVICIEEKNLSEGRMEDRVRFQFPAPKNSRGKSFSYDTSVNAFNVEIGEQASAFLIHLAATQVPEFNR